jgi:hypothetical protein
MLRSALLLALLLPGLARASTVYVHTKDYGWEWDGAPDAFDDFHNGGYRTRAWLEAAKPPRLLDPPRALRAETVRHFDLEEPVTVRFAVLGPPRSTNGHDPYFFAWIEWVTKSDFDFDLVDHRFVRKAGVARVAIEGEGERHLEIRDWHWEKDLRGEELAKIVPWDAAVVARKMLDFHAERPRVSPERANGPGKNAPF